MLVNIFDLHKIQSDDNKLCYLRLKHIYHFLSCPCSIPNLCEMQDTSLAQEIAESFRAKSTESFRLVKIDDLRLVDILIWCVFLLWFYGMVPTH